jgi:hypothetical protein
LHSFNPERSSGSALEAPFFLVAVAPGQIVGVDAMVGFCRRYYKRMKKVKNDVCLVI